MTGIRARDTCALIAGQRTSEQRSRRGPQIRVVDEDLVEDLVTPGQRHEGGDNLAVVEDVDAREPASGVSAEPVAGEHVRRAGGGRAYPHGTPASVPALTRWV
jgi:hypothetical protein